MKFKYIGPNAKDEYGNEMPANIYGGAKVLNGETIELEGWLADKALTNPNYERIKDKPKAAPKRAAKKEVKPDPVDEAFEAITEDLES